MASASYLSGRKAYTRPQAILWTDSYSLSGGLFIPDGVEYNDFIILSDHNRKEIDIDPDRIENRKRMINGKMRSYHIADKEKFSWSWSLLPSRAYDADPTFDVTTGKATVNTPMHTADGGAGGWDIKNWYDTHTGPFWMLLSYDIGQKYGSVTQYTKAVHVYFSSFNHSVVTRGITDLWDISVTLEES